MKTTISVSVDKDAKDSAQAIAKSAGLNLSTLVNAYFNQLAATRRIEFYAPEPMTPKLEKLIAEVEAEIATGNISAPFANAEDFLTDLKR
jgi:addiction module RelB/DinJ family antitoxin